MPIDITKFTVPELFKHIEELPAKDRVGALREIANLRPELKTILRCTYHKNIVFDLPQGDPPYKAMETPENMGHNRLPKEIRKFEYFLPTTNLNAIRREKIFIELLEAVSPEEAKVVLMVKNKKMTYKGFNRKLIEEALPEILEGEQ